MPESAERAGEWAEMLLTVKKLSRPHYSDFEISKPLLVQSSPEGEQYEHFNKKILLGGVAKRQEQRKDS
jgi:hypothetical protein